MKTTSWILTACCVSFLVTYSLIAAQENTVQPPVTTTESGPLPPEEGTAPTMAVPAQGPTLESEDSPILPLEGTAIPTAPAEAPSLPVTEGTAPPPGKTEPPLPPMEGSALPVAEGTSHPPIETEGPLPPAEGTAPLIPAGPQKGYLGVTACRECHESSYQTWIGTVHGKWLLSYGKTTEPAKKAGPGKAEAAGPPVGKIDCESCHGPGSLHPENPPDESLIIRLGKRSSLSRSGQSDICLRCHNKGVNFFWKEGPHENGLDCMTCHRVMEKRSPRALLTGASEKTICFSCHRSVQARMARSPHLQSSDNGAPCSQCHNPHGTAAARMLTSPTVNENCYRCHAEKRGPFLFEHFPVTENCLLCHDPHGSFQKNLLKVRQPFLCLDCHTNLPGTHDPFNPNSRFTYNRACVNCHVQIHGSNHPSGAKFQR